MIRPTRPGKPAPRPEPPKPVAPALTRFRCGHPADLSQLDCGECRAKHYAAKQARSQAKRDAKKDANDFRFPAGTIVADLAWNGVEWSGVLIVPIGPGNEERFPVASSGYERLGRMARELYTAWLESQRK